MEMDVAGGGGRWCLWVADQATQNTRSKNNSENQICMKKRKSKGKSKQNREDLTVDGPEMDEPRFGGGGSWCLTVLSRWVAVNGVEGGSVTP
jgi:hypothetical protein